MSSMCGKLRPATRYLRVTEYSNAHRACQCAAKVLEAELLDPDSFSERTSFVVWQQSCEFVENEDRTMCQFGGKLGQNPPVIR